MTSIANASKNDDLPEKIPITAFDLISDDERQEQLQDEKDRRRSQQRALKQNIEYLLRSKSTVSQTNFDKTLKLHEQMVILGRKNLGET